MNQYETIRKNIIYEDMIFYKKNGKQYIGCLVKSKYADQSDQIEFYLFENKSTKNFYHRLDLINYNKCREQKKDPTWKPTPFQKILFYFELIPRLQQINEIFGTETEDNRMKWMKIFNENIDKLNTNPTYEIASNPPDEKSSDEEEEEEKKKKDITPSPPIESKPFIPPRTFDLKELKEKIPKPDSPNLMLIKEKKPSVDSTVLSNENRSFQLRDDEIFYEKSMEELQKILFNINKSGVYAVSPKVQPESDCTWAIRVFENTHHPLSSWNIYQTGNKYFLFDDGPTFPKISKLCEYYTINPLPKETSTLDHLTSPYKHHLK